MDKSKTNKIPSPPIPPECTLECSLCGYKDVKSKYKHTCHTGIAASIIIIMIPVLLLFTVIVKVINVSNW